MQKNKSSSKLVRLVVLALLATVSLVLFFISFPLPMLPPYLKVDFSDVPALIAALIFSPLAGVLVVFMKNALYFIASGSADPVGVTANFIAGVIYVLPVAYLYHRYKGVKSVVAGLVIGTIGMGIVMSILNYFVLLPAYALFLGMEMTPAIKMSTVMIGVLPFNILKGIIVGMLFVPLFVKLKQFIEQKQLEIAN